jgi:benzoyl-CoA reductase/2-hydroxyglutaryl-CoA dehydratase subunit BcrC/BadD/HgdB
MNFFSKLKFMVTGSRLRFGLRIIKNPRIITRIRRLDGRHTKSSALSIFWFLTRALWRFPGIFDYRPDPALPGVSELTYMILSLQERLNAAREKGAKVVGKWPANPTDLYYGSHIIALDPFFAGFCRILAEGSSHIAKRGRAKLSEDACPAQAAAYTIVSEDVFPLDFFYPFIGPWCYDSQYCFEALRHKVDGDYGDHPVFNKREQAKPSFDYMVKEIKRFMARMEELTGKKVTAEDLRQEFILENKLRKVLREITDYTQLNPPPINSLDLILCIFISSDWLGDPEATLQVLTRIRDGIKKRADKGGKAQFVDEKPIRLLITGIAWGDLGLYNMVDELGGQIVGSECVYNLYYEDIDTEGDPIEVMANRFLTTPYALPAAKRALWTAENVRRFKQVDGVIFNCNFGCNYQAAEARMVTDAIKRETGIPCLITDTDLPRENRGQMRTRLEAFLELIRHRGGEKI